MSWRDRLVEFVSGMPSRGGYRPPLRVGPIERLPAPRDPGPVDGPTRVVGWAAGGDNVEPRPVVAASTSTGTRYEIETLQAENERLTGEVAALEREATLRRTEARGYAGPGVHVLPAVHYEGGDLPPSAAVAAGPHMCDATAEAARLRHEVEDLEAQNAALQADMARLLPAVLHAGQEDVCEGGETPCPWCAHPSRPDDRIPRRPEDHATWCPYRAFALFHKDLLRIQASGIDPGEATAEDIPAVS